MRVKLATIINFQGSEILMCEVSDGIVVVDHKSFLIDMINISKIKDKTP